ncbi:MAG: GTP-binding protein [Phycisphaerales bacterium]|nr:GTP-binding protein [Phycisphaerales bacterium]
MFDRLDDTIVAISTPPGVSVRGMLRLSGPEATALADKVFRADDEQLLLACPGGRRIFGEAHIAEAGSVPAEAYVFRAPASYTRQDVVELYLPGCPSLLAMVLDHLHTGGARPAEPGEFTARAFFSGAMDLTRAEGVAALIHAHNDSQLRASEALLHGHLSQRTTAMRDRLADLLALLEAEIDFTEEPIEFVSREQVSETLAGVAAELNTLIERAPSAERLAYLPEVILIGRANAGKSTLFNRLTGMDRAICSATEGTTRDVLHGPVMLPGGEIRLMDCAGLSSPQALRQAAQSTNTPTDLAEAAARQALRSADMILLVVDAGDAPRCVLDDFMEALPARPILSVMNKTDTLDSCGIPVDATDEQAICVSALTGKGMEDLKKLISRRLFHEGHVHGTDVIALSVRQRAALNEAAESISRANHIMNNTVTLDANIELLAMEIHQATDTLSMLTGKVTTEDLLARVFAGFCIGK